MTNRPDHIADQLIEHLTARGLPADRYTVAPGSAGVNIWAPAAAVTEDDPNLNRYPQVSLLVADSGKFHDISWGANWEHVLPLDTSPVDVVDAVIKTLPVTITQLLDE